MALFTTSSGAAHVPSGCWISCFAHGASFGFGVGVGVGAWVGVGLTVGVAGSTATLFVSACLTGGLLVATTGLVVAAGALGSTWWSSANRVGSGTLTFCVRETLFTTMNAMASTPSTPKTMTNHVN